MNPLKIWCNAALSPAALAELRKGLVGHDLRMAKDSASNLSVSSDADGLGNAEVVFGQPDPAQVIESSSVKWVQITSAGYTRYDTPEFREKIEEGGRTFTNSSSVYDEPCAQHLLAFMLAIARQLPAALIAQREGPRWAFDEIRPKTRLLQDQTVLILSFGAIAQRLVELLSPFGLNIVGVRRHVRGDEPVEMHPIEKLDELLPGADHIVNILPSSTSTDGLIDGNRITRMKPGAVFYNVGRGTTVEQNALRAALESGHLSAAYLDVTDPEPLPADHPLWSAPNCYITPHVAGGHHEETVRLVHHFLANLSRLEQGERLRDEVFASNL